MSDIVEDSVSELNSTGNTVSVESAENRTKSTDFVFSSKGLHIANLNVCHLLPKMDELHITLACENGPDIIGICETFLDNDISDNLLAIAGYDHIRKDRSETRDKTGGGLILYFRNNINCKRRSEFEISNIETIWSEITLPNSKPFLICTAYRPPNETTNWVDLLEEELSAAQASGLELVLMGDFNIDFRSCSNSKWLQLIQLFDLTQLVNDFTRITPSSATIIDHIYCSNPENVVECFVPGYAISDHFPVCCTRKMNGKISKTKHISTSYRCFKHFNESLFLSDLATDLESFHLSNNNVDDDFTLWLSIVQGKLDKHAPIKTRRVKSKRLPDWFTPDILSARRTRDTFKRAKTGHNINYIEIKHETSYVKRKRSISPKL